MGDLVIGILLAVAAIIFGIVSEVEANARNWAGWGVICLAALYLIGRL